MLFTNLDLYVEGKLKQAQTVEINSQGELITDHAQQTKSFNPPHINGQHLFLMPAWFNSHIHGIQGHDFSQGTKKALEQITSALGEHGVSDCLATLISLDIPELKTVLAQIDAYVKDKQEYPVPGEANIVGIHLEGPFISAACKGAHKQEALQSRISMDIFKDIIASAPHIKEWKMTLAPDIEGAIDFIKQTQQFNRDEWDIHLQIFIGHTNAAPPLIQAAMEAGAVGVTHLGNAMQEKVHRSAQLIQQGDVKSHVVKWALTHKTYVELIIDGEHLSEAFLHLVYQQLPKQIILITDSVSAAGCPDGEYQLGSLAVIKKGARVELKNQPGTLAGSAALFPEVVKHYFDFLKKNGLSTDEIMDAIYQAAVVNPRTTSSRPATSFDDKKNFVLLHKQTGKLMLSCCNGKLHPTSEWLAYCKTHLNQHGLSNYFETKEIKEAAISAFSLGLKN